MMSRLEQIYGEGPLHLIAVVVTFAVVGYALLETLDRLEPISFGIWFVGAIVAHDLIAFPLYSLLGVVAGSAAVRGGGVTRNALNYVRVPAVLSAFALIVWFPLIVGFGSEGYERVSGQSADAFLGRWLLLTAVLFLLSGVLYALSLRRRGGRS